MDINGKVYDNSGNPLIGAVVVELNSNGSLSNNGTVTDNNGNFSLSVQPDSTIQFSYIGYQTKNVPSENAKNVILTTSTTQLPEVTVTAKRSSSTTFFSFLKEYKVPIGAAIIVLITIFILESKK